MNFTKVLISWYSINKRTLPWRETQNPYFIWLSEIILQQTQVSQGLPYYRAFVSQFPTIFELAKADEEEVLKLWQGLGYYSRARNLHFTARYVVNELNGKFPVVYKDLIQLKGVGDYTASAIASICNDEHCAVVDGNVYRVLARYFGVETPINTSAGVKEFKVLAQKLLPDGDIGNYNQAIMEFGSIQCCPKNPDCHGCPLNHSCIALKTNKVNNLPVKLKKLKITNRYFNYLVFISGSKTVLKKRTKKDIWQNLYEFPLIETEQKETIKTFGKNEDLKVFLNGNDNEISLYNKTEIVHKLSHQHLNTKFWIVNMKNLDKNVIEFSELYKYPVPTLIKNFIDEFNFPHS